MKEAQTAAPPKHLVWTKAALYHPPNDYSYQRHVVNETFFQISFDPALFVGYALSSLYDLYLCLLLILCALLCVHRLSDLCDERSGKRRASSAYHHVEIFYDGHPYGVVLHFLYDVLRAVTYGHSYVRFDVVGSGVCALLDALLISIHSSEQFLLFVFESAIYVGGTCHSSCWQQSSLRVDS